MIQIEKIAENLFDKIRSRFDGVSIGDENAKATLDPEKARFFNFDFSVDGQNYGNVTLSLVDEQNLKVYFDKEMDAAMSEEHEQNWFNFLRNLRLFAKRNLLTFDIRDIAKSGLNLKDLRHANKDAQVLNKNDIAVTESKLYGTSRSSYESLGNDVRIIARHKNRIVDDTKPGARSRNIQAFYIENSLGERVRCPEGTTLNGARAMARHVKNGGALHDDFGQYISKVVKEMSSLKTFVRNMRGRQFEDAETGAMVESAIDHYGKLHRDLFTIRSQRGYEQYRALWQPEELEEDNVDIDALREKFVRRVFDDRLLDALPIVHRAYKTRKDAVGEEFESWANSIVDEESDNPIDQQNKISAAHDKDLEEDEIGVNVSSPIANAVGDEPGNDGNVMDGDVEDKTLEDLFDKNGFEFRFQNGVYYFESREEVERAKDIIAQFDSSMPMPRFGIYDYGYGVYGSSTFDVDLSRSSAGVMEGSDSISDIQRLAGLAK
jgi:hypothetical protein